MARAPQPIPITSINQTLPTPQRKCACGGGCPRCNGELPIQTKLTIGAPDDAYEREADRVADRVMRMPEPKVQRQVEEEEEELLQAKASPGGVPDVTPGLDSRIHVMRGGGQPLPESERAFFEPRFGHDFSQVRVHADDRAAEAAQSVNAQAFTVGRNIFFGAGEYQPGSENGKRILAHELTHVVQQRGGAAGANAVQRKVVVEPDPAAAGDILNQFQSLCPQGNFGLSGKTITENCLQSINRSCECLCDTAIDPVRTYTIKVEKAANQPRKQIFYGGCPAIVPFPSAAPGTRDALNPTITMPASTGSQIEFGAFDASGNAFWPPTSMILAHELCGHGRLRQDPGGPGGNRPGHDSTIEVENAIAGEQPGAQPARGFFANVRQGESFYNPVGNRSKVFFSQKDGNHHEAPSVTGLIRGKVTASALRVRARPSLTASPVCLYLHGVEVPIECGTSGDPVQGNAVWFQTAQGFVSSHFMPIFAGGRSPPGCGQALGGAAIGEVTASFLHVRAQPRLTGQVVGGHRRGRVVSVECQTSGDAVEGNSVWFRTLQGFMSSRFITLVSGGPVPNC